MRALGPLFLVLGVVGGCACPCDFVAGARTFSDSVLPEYKSYLNDDDRLHADARRSAMLVVEKWERMLEEAEAGCAQDPKEKP